MKKGISSLLQSKWEGEVAVVRVTRYSNEELV